MKILTAALVSLAFFCCLGGCLRMGFTDVTKDPKYGALIGKVYELQTDFIVYGVRRDLSSATLEYHVLVQEYPGIGGPELVRIARLPAGTRIQVIGVIEESTPVSSSALYVVRVMGAGRSSLEKLSVRISRVVGQYDHPDAQGLPRLASRYFRQLSP